MCSLDVDVYGSTYVAVSCAGSFWPFLRSFFSEELFYGDFWSLGLLSTSLEQVTKAAVARLSYTSAVRLVRPQLLARALRRCW